METNWLIIIPVLVAVAVVAVFLVIQYQKDEIAMKKIFTTTENDIMAYSM